jgi:hypothetical protein
MRSKDSVIALKDLPFPELRIFGPFSGVTSVYRNGAVVIEDSIGHGHLASRAEIAGRLGKTAELTAVAPGRLEKRPLREVLAAKEKATEIPTAKTRLSLVRAS